MNKEVIEKAGKIIQTHTGKNFVEGSEPYCILALIDLEGYPTASAITPAQTEGIRKISMCTGLNTNKTKRIENCNRAGVCFSSLEYNITLTGTIKIITDHEVKKEMWYEGLNHHFSGPEDPAYCVLEFTTEKYNLFVDWQEIAGEL